LPWSPSSHAGSWHKPSRSKGFIRVHTLSGGAALDRTALATFAFERRDGRWLLVQNHVSRVPQQ
jgi:hypothetical protein